MAQHAQLLMPNIQIRERGFLVISLLRFNDERINVISSTTNFQREAVLFMFRKVV